MKTEKPNAQQPGHTSWQQLYEPSASDLYPWGEPYENGVAVANRRQLIARVDEVEVFPDNGHPTEVMDLHMWYEKPEDAVLKILSGSANKGDGIVRRVHDQPFARPTEVGPDTLCSALIVIHVWDPFDVPILRPDMKRYGGGSLHVALEVEGRAWQLPYKALRGFVDVCEQRGFSKSHVLERLPHLISVQGLPDPWPKLSALEAINVRFENLDIRDGSAGALRAIVHAAKVHGKNTSLVAGRLIAETGFYAVPEEFRPCIDAHVGLY